MPIALALFLCASGAHAQGTPIVLKYLNQPGMTQGKFLKAFPYDQYVRIVSIDGISALQVDRLAVWKKFGDGDEFIYAIASFYIKKNPPNSANRGQYISTSEKLLSPDGAGVNAKNKEIYQIIGYYFLSNIGDNIIKEYRGKKFDPSSAPGKATLERLASDKVHLSFDESDINKVMSAAKSGDFGYIFNRFMQKVGAKFKKNQAPIVQPKLKLTPRALYFPDAQGSAYQVYNITDRGNPVGHALFMRRPFVHVKYFARNASERFHGELRGGRVLAAATGGFTNDHSKPEGLAIEEGEIVNAVLMPDRHGLVVLGSDGSVRVIDLKRDTVKLPTEIPNRNLEVQNPLRDLRAYAVLLKWAKAHQATLFQTQLMAHGDQLLIDPSKASSKTAERRMLALARDDKDVLYDVLFDMPNPYTLYDLSSEIFAELKSRKMKVEALLNLDTGAQNVFYAYDDQSRNMKDLRGVRASQRTTNMVVFEH